MNSSPKRSRSKIEKNQSKSFLKPGWQLALFVLAHLVIFVFIFHSIYKTPYSATGIYFDYASKVLNGALPYRDFSLEYPPFALVFFLLPRLFASTWARFSIYYQTEVLIFDLIGLLIIYLIARRLGKSSWKLMSVYTLAFLAIGPIIGQQYDVFPAVLTLLSLYFFWRGKHKISWLLLALGTMTKFYPAVIAPVFVFYYLRNRQYRNLWSGVLIFALTCLIVLAPFFILSPESIRNLITYHSQRGLQLESTYSAFLLVADKLGLTKVGTIFNYGSWNLTGHLADLIAKASTYVLGLLLLAAYWFIYGQIRPGKSQFSRIGTYSLLLVTITLVASKVFSPQYLIWLIPLVPLVFNRFRYLVLVVFVAIGAATFYIFPSNYLTLLNLDTRTVAILFLRDILLVLLAVVAFVSLTRMKSSE
jgi:uncharacterized membrane protein